MVSAENVAAKCGLLLVRVHVLSVIIRGVMDRINSIILFYQSNCIVFIDN